MCPSLLKCIALAAAKMDVYGQVVYLRSGIQGVVDRFKQIEL